MNKIKDARIEYIDDDHIYVDNRQFISLRRFTDMKVEIAKETKLLLDKHNELIKENEALKILLKNNI